MSGINTNITSLTTQQGLKKSQSTLATSMERLSSGMRINSAKDDAAGQAIANRMEANLRAGDKISQGVGDGISLMQTAEGGLDGINGLLQRSRQLAVQASSDTLSDTDRASINGEFHQLRDEIDRISRETEIFDKHPLAPADSGEVVPQKLGDTDSVSDVIPSDGRSERFTSGIVSTAFIPEGAKDVTLTIDALTLDDDIQLFTRDGKHLAGTPLRGDNPDFVWEHNNINSSENADERVLTPENGFFPDASYDDSSLNSGGEDFSLDNGKTSIHNSNNKEMKITYSGDGDRYEKKDEADEDNRFNNGEIETENSRERIKIDEVTEDLVFMVVGKGSFNAKADWGAMPQPTVELAPPPPPYSEPVDIVTSANYGDSIDKVTIEPTPADSATLGIGNSELDPAESAREALGELDSALNKVNDYRGQYGALNNRFESIIDNQKTENINTASAQSRIIDADYAKEVATMTKSQITQQAGNSMLAQANTIPESVLTLLQ